MILDDQSNMDKISLNIVMPNEQVKEGDTYFVTGEVS